MQSSDQQRVGGRAPQPLDAYGVDLASCALAFGVPVLFWALGAAPFGWFALVVTAGLIVLLRTKELRVDRSSWVLITGGNSGIGLELALEMSKTWNVIITGRDRDRLAEAADAIRAASRGCEVRTIAKDLSASSSSHATLELYQEAKSIGKVVALVNNAGFGFSEPFATEPLDDIDAMIACNMTAVAQLTRHFLPDLLQQRYGYILNVASTAGFSPGAGMALYCATKAFVVSLSEALHLETRGTGVVVSALCPGATNTRFEAKAGNDQSVLFKLLPVMRPKEVAQAAMQGLRRGDRLIFPGANAGAYWFSKLLPGALWLGLTKWALSKPGKAKST